MILYIGLIILFFIIIIAYFRVADYFNIIDHPNERSSHSEVTIRGGGIIFLFAASATLVLYPAYWLAAVGTLVIGVISFFDDILTLSSKIRLLFHLVAVTFLFLYLNVFTTLPVYVIPILYILVIGVINMYNFMDGINGITGAYSLVVLAGLQYVNLKQIAFVDKDVIWIPMLACSAFLYFNFRKKARCFAGDVGSVTLAFWIITMLLKLILITNNWEYILFLVVYGVDAVLTIVHRLMLKQNIFKAHRLHFYQVLANEQKIPHLWVTFGYSIFQAVIIAFVIINRQWPVTVVFIVAIVPLAVIYVGFKPYLLKMNRR